MKVIITQDRQIVNFDRMVSIFVYTANTFHAKFDIRALDNTSGTTYITLASYDTKRTASDVLEFIIDWLKTEEPLIDLTFPDEIYEDYQEEAGGAGTAVLEKNAAETDNKPAENPQS